MQVYRISDATIREMSEENAQAILAHQTKGENHRAYFVDPEPVPAAGQRVQRGPVVVTPTEARQTWELVAKTAAEIEVEELQAELAQVDQLITDVQTQLAIDNATFNAATTAGKFDILRADRRLLLRTARFVLRRIRRGVI